METKPLKPLIALGVAVIAVCVSYFLLRQTDFQLSMTGATASAVLAILLLLLGGSMTVFALLRWAPLKRSKVSHGIAHTEENANATVLTVSGIEELRSIICDLTKKNRQLLFEIAGSTDGQYLGDLAMNRRLMLSRGEILYRARELQRHRLVDVFYDTDQRLKIGAVIHRVTGNDLSLFRSLLEEAGL